MKKLSYMKCYFLKMLLIVTILVVGLVFTITGFSRNVVGNEIISLHRSILNQTIRQTAETIRRLKESMDKITDNVRVIDWVMNDVENEAFIDSFIQGEIYGNYKSGNKFRVYIYDLDELRYASDYPEISWEDARSVISQAELSGRGRTGGGIYVEGPVRSEEESGLYRHSLYMVKPIIDLLNRQVHGYVLLQISEVVLYDTYASMIGATGDYCIVDKYGVVVSAGNKNHIGLPYDKNDIAITNTEVLGSGYGISESYPDSVYFYENIAGTSWYLLENANLRHLFSPIDRLAFFSYLLVALFIVCFLPVTFFSLRVILKPIDAIKNRMNMVAGGELQARIEETQKGKGELSEIADSFNYMVEKLERQVDEIYTIERKKHLLQLDFLQAQINPHFIQNTLSSIRFYVEMGKNEEAEKMLIDFSKILRKTLSSSEKMIHLNEEIEILLCYIELQKARYRERFEVELDIQEQTLSCVVPDFIIQPIVENAIFYSLKEKQVCHIWIRSYLDDGKLYVTVKDDGVGMDENEASFALEQGANMNKVGIRNVKERIKLNFGEEYGVRIVSEKGVGTEVILEMPIL